MKKFITVDTNELKKELFDKDSELEKAYENQKPFANAERAVMDACLENADKDQAWNYALGMVEGAGLKPSEDFLELVEKEKRGEISMDKILEYLNQKYEKLSAPQ